MKQGSGNSSDGGRKREPMSRAINPAGVSQIGEALGNHTDRGTTNYKGDRVRMGAGFTAPMDEGRTIHHNGSQKRR